MMLIPLLTRLISPSSLRAREQVSRQ